ncbi:MAG: sulfatase-like hydrolase/transferase [Armatimonadota bacterium]
MAGTFTRREFIKRAGAAALVMSAAPRDDGVNVLFLMTDQQHHRALSAAGNRVIQTPNLDRLAREGVRFTNACCATPFCSPTRASLVTGLWPHRHGINSNVQRGQKGLTPDFTLTEGLLHDRGAVCHHRGKWHLGDTRVHPCYAGDVDPAPNYLRYLDEHVPADQFPSKPNQARLWRRPVDMLPFMYEAHLRWNQMANTPRQDLSIIGRLSSPPPHTMASWVADKVVELVEQNAGRRFMITCSISDPHAYWVAPDPYYSMYDRETVPLGESGTGASLHHCPRHYQAVMPHRLGMTIGDEGIREYVAVYYGMVSQVDWCFGKILDRLDALGLADNTLVVFTADHGDMQGGHGMVGKSLPACYEEIVRVPLIFRLPGVIPAGRVVRAHANSVDVMPTILDYARIPIPADIDGASLRPFIEGRGGGDRAFGFSERTGGGGKFIQRMIRTHEWKYVYNSKHWPCQLFHLATDPDEMVNRIDDPKCRGVLKRLHKRLAGWMEETSDPHIDLLQPPWA